ncbi:two-component system sensor histidine kinase CreC [Cognatilysobacter lacus]|uniref:histidine kinase n=1 Tax=Cognatilysobacter lacus TaxID=1643323 RepID=A0A5D8ZB02_9GAMM|nr:two-component system sensor histidine kinase CreC [Lysobacter lacus]TZF91726.1 two-component system sensor histidine kinase CreC [Lysobacter lacus]
MRIGLRIFLGYFAIVALAGLIVTQVFVAQVKPGVRQAMEDTLVDTANVLAELAADDLAAGHIRDGRFARHVRDLRNRDPAAAIWGFSKRRTNYRIYVTDARGVVVFDSDGVATGRDFSRWNDVYRTLHGRYGARSTLSDPSDPTSTVMHVAAPVRDETGRLIGVLTVAKPNRVLQPFIERSQGIITRWGAGLLGAALLTGLAAAWWLSRQLGMLQRYAQAVTAGDRAVLPSTAGEFAELGRALETMRTKLEGKQYVEQYVHTLTHEMKSPLAAIRASAELLERPMTEAEHRGFVSGIRAQSERLARMIDNLLALAAVEHSQRLEAPAPIDVGELLAGVAADCTERLRSRGQSLRVRVGPDLPTRDGDAFLLRQALVNLVENASDFAAEGTDIDLGAERIGDHLQLHVRDRGPGIPDYATARVFERFYSLPRPEGGSRSSGLGLCFVAEVAHLHAGHARLRNRDDGGAEASIDLPV